MAAAVVSAAVKRISNLLIQEAVFLVCADEEIQRLQAELMRMQCFLKDADLKQEHDERVRNWISEIRDVAYDAEDIIDAFIIKVAGSEGRFRGVLQKLVLIFIKGLYICKIHKQIKSINTKIADISNGMQKYGVQFIVNGDGNQRQLRRSYPHMDEDAISLEDSTRDLMAQLMVEDERFHVVAIVGMGGLGKTTLAKRVYNDINVKRHFDCSAWAFISQKCATKDVLHGILTKVAKEGMDLREGMKEEELTERLYQVLSEKRYLVVLDDIWRNEAWDSLKPAFPNGKKGSKVLFTTRNKEVASYADPWSSPIELRFLTHEESWELLLRKAFPVVVANHGCTPEFEKIGREMVRKCDGLPLAIVVLGGLLATKRSLDEWKEVGKNIDTCLRKFQQQQHYGGVYGILALSYHELPFHLKPCFLHLGLFPEDWEIPKKKLIRLWIAEGFVTQPCEGEGEETMEDLAEQYLEDLINRCMVQVGETDSCGRGVNTCRIHDLMRELCVLKAGEENFLRIIQQEAGVSPNSPSVLHLQTVKLRRIAIHPLVYSCQSHQRYVPVVEGYAQLRSLLCFVKKDQVNLMRRGQEISVFKEFNQLRVLELERVKINFTSRTHKAMGSLIHLRYLGLKLTTMCYVPQSIANLRYLQTLDIRGNSAVTLPRVMSKLVNLRHLLFDNIQEAQCRMDTLINLKSLKYIDAQNLIRGNAMLKLSHLQNLGIRFETSEEAEVVLESPVMRSGSLRSLHMEMLSMHPFSSLESLSHCPRLAKFRINGRIVDSQNDHHNLEFLPVNLTKLILCNSRLQQDPMVMLEKLPNLRFLYLDSNSYSGTEMVCSVHGFPRLENLMLNALELKEWQVAEGAMPSLRDLHISYLLKLRMIPEGLKSVTTLRELRVVWKPKAFVNRLQVVDGVKGEDFYKVQHVPSILIGSLAPDLAAL